MAVAVVDDRSLLGESFAIAVNAQAADVTAKHWNSAEVLADPDAVLTAADVILVCIGRSNLLKGPAKRLIETLLAKHDHPPIIVLADKVGPAMAQAGIRLGVRGVMSSRESLRTVVEALRYIRRGGAAFPPVHR